MKTYKSFLAEKLKAFIAYRKSLGYLIGNQETYLVHFDRFVYEKSVYWQDLNPELCIDFIKWLDLAPITVNNAIFCIRGFFRYLERLEIISENPMKDIASKKTASYIPYIFSRKDTRQLVDAVNNNIRKNQKDYFRDYTLYMVILLLARCGLRISEPLNLRVGHYRNADGTIFIQNTKFNKDRCIPVSRSVMGEISNYLSVRKHLINHRSNPYLFPGKQLFKIDRRAVYNAFYQAVNDIGIKQEKIVFDHIRFGKPTPHSLRHSFAINTLKRIRERGKSPQDSLPVLAAYMGHKNYMSTAVYLKALDAQQRQGLFDITIKGLNVI